MSITKQCVTMSTLIQGIRFTKNVSVPQIEQACHRFNVIRFTIALSKAVKLSTQIQLVNKTKDAQANTKTIRPKPELSRPLISSKVIMFSRCPDERLTQQIRISQEHGVNPKLLQERKFIPRLRTAKKHIIQSMLFV